MIAELRAKSQITIPKEIIADFSLNTGDKLDIVVKDGMICMIPVEVYPKAYIDELKRKMSLLWKDYQSTEERSLKI